MIRFIQHISFPVCCFAFVGRWRIHSGQIQLDWFKWTSSSL